jgi:hypothetical protein
MLMAAENGMKREKQQLQATLDAELVCAIHVHVHALLPRCSQATAPNRSVIIAHTPHDAEPVPQIGRVGN